MAKPVWKKDPDIADQIYDILIQECGASEWMRSDFVFNFPTREFRFQGALGFGGKFWADYEWSVNCYREDQTEERTAMIDAANVRLSALQKQYEGKK